jgi:hypothetical protein
MDQAATSNSRDLHRPGALNWVRRVIHPFVPAGFHDPVGLARRLLRNPDPAARFSVLAAATAPLAVPIDALLAPFERRRYRLAGEAARPIVLVCGSARSGTSLAAQLLIRNLPVAYFDNLVSVFSRSPVMARRLFGSRVERKPVAYQSFYGRTQGWSAPSDALNLWDRWLGTDRSRIPERLEPEARAEMSAFFAAFEQETGMPLVAKNNALNASAHLVAEALPTARFVCVERSPDALALSLYRARMDIHGESSVPYGLTVQALRHPEDAVEDVCRQVLFHEQLALQQQARLGAERFVIVRYEDICRDPRAYVEAIGRSLLDVVPDFDATDPDLESFPVGLRAGDDRLLARIRETLTRLGPAGGSPGPGSSPSEAPARD